MLARGACRQGGCACYLGLGGYASSHSKSTTPKAILEVIEIPATCKSSWEDAAAHAVKHASRTVCGIRSVNIRNQRAVVTKGKITEYRVNRRVSFGVE